MLKVERVDHGVQSAKDPALMQRLAQDRIPLTVCPLSNLKLCVFPDLAQHNLGTLLDAGLVLPVTGTKKYRAQLAVDPDTRSRDPRVRQLLPVLRRLADRTGDAVFLVVREEDDSISLHREIGSYPVQILATYAGKRQPLGVGSGGMALLAALPDDIARGIVERNSGRLDEYGGMTPQEMYRLIENTRARGYSVVGNHAVRGALGVGCALLDSQGAPPVSYTHLTLPTKA